MSHSECSRGRRSQRTWTEKLMWRWLRGRRFSGYKFRRQHPLGPYILDFFCEAARLSVELDGFGHGHPQQQAHDAVREKFLVTQAIKELRFWNSQLRRNAEGIRAMIFQALQERAPRPLPDYTKPMSQRNARPHPGPLPQEREH